MQAVLHRVYRYGAEGENWPLVSRPSIRKFVSSASKCFLLGDERVVLGVNFVAEITPRDCFS